MIPPPPPLFECGAILVPESFPCGYFHSAHSVLFVFAVAIGTVGPESIAVFFKYDLKLYRRHLPTVM